MHISDELIYFITHTWQPPHAAKYSLKHLLVWEPNPYGANIFQPKFFSFLKKSDVRASDFFFVLSTIAFRAVSLFAQFRPPHAAFYFCSKYFATYFPV